MKGFYLYNNLNGHHIVRRTLHGNHLSATPCGCAEKKIYTNSEIRELLGVQDKLIRKYRDDGKLAYHKEGDKFWYLQEDIDQFLSHNHYEAYAYN